MRFASIMVVSGWIAGCGDPPLLCEFQGCEDPPPIECIEGNTVLRTYPSTGVCDVEQGGCVYEPVDTPCDDCTASCLGQCEGVVCDDLAGGCRVSGACVPGDLEDAATCAYEPADDGTACDDGDPCTAADQCIDENCLAVPVEEEEPCDGEDGFCVGGVCVECLGAEQCDDDNLCTIDQCTANSCNSLPDDGAPCDDADPCTDADSCLGGSCQATPIADGQPCVDGQLGLCLAGACVDCIGDLDCDDGNLCTTDTCSGNACTITNDDGAACDDADPCTASDECLGGSCQATPIADGQPCVDGEIGLCFAGACVECITAADCDDGNPCTADVCSGNVCSNPNDNGAACDDGDACTQGDVCQNGACGHTLVISCTALSDCHDVGVCNPATGICSNPTKALGASCDDDDLCTYDDECDGAGTCGGTDIACTDTLCVDRECNGTNVCTETNATAGTFCGGCSECDGSGSCDYQCSGSETCCFDLPNYCIPSGSQCF
ncbi:MAG: hypothetical protein KTR31_33365 [Myxococcales bacterium]|nr:hypothetical protein [Myxococcales bacterium]